MKRFIAIFLILTLLASLSACNNSSVPATDPTQQTPTTEQSNLQDTYVPDPIYENMYSISMPIVHEYLKDEAGNIIFDYAYQSMYLIIPDTDVADKIIIDFLKRIDEAHSEAQDMMYFAQQAPSANCSYRIQYDTTRIDQGVLSLFGYIIQVNDAMHADYRCISANYDMVTGDVLTLGSILYHADQKDELETLVISNMEKNDSIGLYDDFRNTVSGRFQTDESEDEDFYFSPSGLCFYFSPYEVAPYSAGVVTVEIPYNQLTGIIGDAYFPAERTLSQGDIQIIPFADASLEEYELFAEIIADSNGTKLLLTTDQSVQDVCIQQLEWSDGQTELLSANTIFAANIFKNTDGILFEANFNSDRPAYGISYTKNGETFQYYFIGNEIIELRTEY